MKRYFRWIFILAYVFVCQPAFAVKADGLNEAMMGENITGGIGDFHIESKDSFTADSREVIWFASFKGFIGAPEARLTAEWVTPAGEVFKKEKFTTQWGNSRFGWAKLDIRGADRVALELEGQWTVKVYWDDELIDQRGFYMGVRRFAKVALPEEPVASTPQIPPKASAVPASVSVQKGSRFVRTVSGNKVVYEGPEQVDPNLWKIEKIPFNQLKFSGPQNASKSIAVLAYPYDLDIVPNNFAFDRAKYMADETRKSGFKMSFIPEENTLPEQYKYLLRYNLDQKKVEINFFSKNSDVFFDLVEFSEERDKVKNADGLLQNGSFPHDLSGHIARKTVENFTKNGYRVLDLTGSREELAGRSPDAIMSSLHEKYGVDRIMFIPIKAYTKWVWDSGSSKQTEIGLMLCYSVVVFERDNPEPVFTFTENIDIGNVHYGFLGSRQKLVKATRLNFYSEDWSEDRKKNPNRPIKFYKDGILDDTWATTVILDRFAGVDEYSSSESKVVRVGGKLFEKLREAVWD